jgi:hypothetical protein
MWGQEAKKRQRDATWKQHGRHQSFLFSLFFSLALQIMCEYIVIDITPPTLLLIVFKTSESQRFKDRVYYFVENL